MGWIWQGLLQEGAQKIAIVGLPPMGCLPIMITLNGGLISDRKCIEKFSSVARDYNLILKDIVKSMQQPKLKIVYGDIYEPLDDMIRNPQNYG